MEYSIMIDNKFNIQVVHQIYIKIVITSDSVQFQKLKVLFPSLLNLQTK